MNRGPGGVAAVAACALLAVLSLASASATKAAAAPVPNSPVGAWGQPVGVDPCGSQDKLDRILAGDPALRQRRELFERLVREAERKNLLPRLTAGPPTYVIPIAVHIVHQGGAENISDNQVLSQIAALNRDCANTPANGSPAVDTKIQFCLATLLPPASPVVWSTTPGITRNSSPETNHIYLNPTSETALKAISYLPSNRYLNIWVVKTISGGSGGVAGYATFPGAVPATLDGIVMRYDVFGSNTTGYGTFSLLPSNDDGKILAHEAGHWLNLYHPFQGGCAPPGDQVADTPPEAVNRTGCPTTGLSSCTAANDPIENFMDYTNDACRFAFTAGQTTRMYAAIVNYRAMIVGAQNLIDAGCPSGLNAQIVASPSQICAGDTVNFTTPAAGGGYTYAWVFPGGTPATATTQSASVIYPTAGIQTATLTVTDGGTNYSTNTRQVYVIACSPIQTPCANWVFPGGCALSFTTGAPVAFPGTVVGGPEPAAMMSSASGSLLFYTDGVTAFTATNVPMPNGSGLLAGISSHNGAIAMRRPGSANQYFLFTVRNWEDNFTPNPLNYNVIDMTLNGTLGDIVSGQKNLAISLPGSPTRLLEGLALVPHCNSTDWWLITHGSDGTSGKIFVTLITAAGPGATTVYSIGMSVPGTPAGAITPSLDGTKLAMINLASDEIAAYNFDRSTGAVTTLLAPTNVQAWADIAFSPNGKLLYYSYFTGTTYGVKQLEIATLQTRDLLSNAACGIKPGPDGLLYIAPGGSSSIHCVNFPDQFNTANVNECGLNLNSVPMPLGKFTALYGALPNMTLQCFAAQPAQFTYTVSGCTNVSFSALNCAGPYTWNFGDASPLGSGKNVSHTYTSPGVYVVTLTVAGASPATVQQTLTLQTQPVSIAGSSSVCVNPYNYSAIGPASYIYQWTITGGSPASAPGNNVDVTWGVGGGTIQLVATDPATGCSTTITKIVGPCPVCAPPPANMSAWYPLDEPTGALALETVLGANANDVNAPAHAIGKVKRGRSLNGVNQYLQANDAPGINFGAGDLTIDAWVRTTAATGIQSIVDKRVVDPEQGYALYLKNGRIALRLGDGAAATGTEYWSATTPFVADGQWHHVAGVERRAATSNGTRLYVDGAVAASFPAYSGGSVTNTEKLLIGSEAGFSGPVSWFNGDLDEVEMFQRSLSTSELLGIYQADSLGKCKEFSWVPEVSSICRDQTDVTLTMLVCNYTTAPQAYALSFTGLPLAGPCTWNGPTTFTVLGPNPVPVPANSCVSVQFKVNRPAGMPLYATTCYQVTVTNTVSTAATVNLGSIYAVRRWCNFVIGTDVGFGNTSTSRSLRYTATNTSDEGPITLPYTVTVRPATDGLPVAPVVGLNGHDPGVPVTGELTLAPGDSADITVEALFWQRSPFHFYDIVLAMDEDGDGLPDAQGDAGLYYREADSRVTTPEPEPKPLTHTLTLAVTPNPVRGIATVTYEISARGRVDLVLYDLAGRRVQAMTGGMREAGRGIMRVPTAGLARGVYFARIEVNGRRASRRFVILE